MRPALAVGIMLALLLPLHCAFADTVDMNRLAIGSSGEVVSGGDFVARISLGETASGTASSDDFNVTLGFAYDNLGPETTATVSGSSVNFSCTDGESNCKVLSYSLNDTNYFAEWTGPSEVKTVTVSGEGTHRIFYYSSDHSDNNETGKLTSVYIPPAKKSGGGGGTVTPPKKPELEELYELENFFVQLEDPSIPVLDSTNKDVLEKKRFAGENEIVLSRAIKAFALIGEKGIILYTYKVTLQVENISGKNLFGVEVIEGIPKEMVESASMIASNADYSVIEEDPILRFLFGNMEPWEKKSAEYDFNRTAAQGPITEQAFNATAAPTALVALTQDDLCLGIECNDFNPCTRDYCVKGECSYVSMKNGARCGDSLVCADGQCIQGGVPVGQAAMPAITITSYETIAIILLLGAVALGFYAQASSARFLKRRKRKG